MKAEEIRYKNLSWPLKVAVIAAWIYLVEFVFYFGLGFVIGLAGW